MTKRAFFLATLFLVFSAHFQWADAHSNHRFTLDREWKRIQASQERQAEKFKALEREAEQMQKDMNKAKGTDNQGRSGGRR